MRYGGDEFVCAMPNIRRSVAAERMTAIAASLSTTELRPSIGFGIAELEPDDGLEDLVGRADADLLTARRSRQHGT